MAYEARQPLHLTVEGARLSEVKMKHGNLYTWR
jgi:hypothetical protein